MNNWRKHKQLFTGQVNAKNGTATDEVAKQRAQEIRQQVSIADVIRSSGRLHRYVVSWIIKAC